MAIRHLAGLHGWREWKLSVCTEAPLSHPVLESLPVAIVSNHQVV